MERAYRQTLEQMGGSSETVETAIKLIRQAKARTRPGSGHELGEYSTGLVPICGLLASEQLNNDEITPSAAQPASCLNKASFKKAYQILKTVLQDNKTKGKRLTCEMLLRKYIVALLAAQLGEMCQLAQGEVMQLGMKASQITNEVMCGIFLWVCAAAKVPDLPTVDDLAAEYGTKPATVQTFITSLNKKLPELKRKIAQETKPKASSASPTKATPRRTPGRPKRELLTRESVRKQAEAAQAPAPDDDDDDERSFPETPTKKRRLDSTPNLERSARTLFDSTIRASSSKTTLDTPTRPSSPLKKSTTFQLQAEEEVDAAEVQTGLSRAETVVCSGSSA
ncbi:hypothetical protein CC1G_03346 [Coprinopsis cinerea okayama7|uniref:Origin recognition complex subunit 6 n=1 Tax=Coprinopsis cinerea (strain Okayama-7 / 130 / ATCC MYA-4618 / FGSC 9003) TaxID=240176 RepID=A8NQW9_COPC7|nr:hypothetical protein CC1G_03346 [Coprinopsis cinerea okayama7\|eukprot:XP_001835564.2 hypothetical protein CC1G_03346 [Coprinopsis cinerea okayama7\